MVRHERVERRWRENATAATAELLAVAAAASPDVMLDVERVQLAGRDVPWSHFENGANSS